ncbi:MAG: acyl-CoA dehydratase activase-related protein [Pseudomonadales bacterium]|nr:acyl-CoA dehydratase activase-related protein [Pseudomonadales bacterium]
MPEYNQLYIGIDVGSTTVKLVVVADDKEIIWSKYERHETRQPEKVLEMLQLIESQYPSDLIQRSHVFITGSGAGPIAPTIGARFVQEVNAVTLAVEKLHPEAGSVIELGGQDAKIIIFKENKETGNKQAITSMNDKCASGTGATIDKCFIKVGMAQSETSKLHFDPNKLHHVAAKCGVFAETDIVNLVKSGVPKNEIMCSLADAIVQQNISVLTRGNTLRSQVILLGGPNTYLPFLQECWRYRIPETWEERGYDYDKTAALEDLISVPSNSEYYAAYGAVLFGMRDAQDAGYYEGTEKLIAFITTGRKSKLGEAAGPALTANESDADAFVQQYKVAKFKPKKYQAKQKLKGVIGLDGGSTSSKIVLIDENSEVIKKVYCLSKGNPIADMKDMMTELRQWAVDDNIDLEILGFGVTGYAGDVLEKALSADCNIVETVAHMKSATHYFPDADVICDIGGQDIKVLFLRNKDIQNFRLSNACSAGNGMLLQAMADQFGIPVTEYADTAFKADLSPNFSYGCAVFLDSDRVNFQKEGYTSEELLAGLALVLPKNVWQYVVQIPRMSELGKVFVLQGGTQNNLAAVKAQVDYIKERVPEAEVHVHPHTGEAGAIGAAYEALRVVKRRGHSTFVGLDNAIDIQYTATTDETTRCDFCANNCSRTFIDTVIPASPDSKEPNKETTARYISGFSCEKGTVEDYDALRELNKQRRVRMKRFPNMVDLEAKYCFKPIKKPEPLPSEDSTLADISVKKGWFGKVTRIPIERQFNRSGTDAIEKRRHMRVGIPRVLNVWSTGPFWRTYFETLGINRHNVVFSDETTEENWQAGGKYGSVDPCFPAKVVQAHIHNLFFEHHTRKPLDFIFFPGLTHVPTFVEKTMDTACCPIVAGTPEVIKAAFTKEKDFFAERNIKYINPTISLGEPLLLKKLMFDALGEQLQMTEDESDFAIDEAFKALKNFDVYMQERGREILEYVEQENKVAILMIGRPYHNDLGLNHGILEEFQALGYPILSIKSIPKDREYLDKFFAKDLEMGRIDSPLEIHDVWPENYSVNSVQKVWAAKFAARHPNIAVLDLSSFKCGHDAPTYGMIDNIIGATETPYSALHDIDANKPSGSIKIRVKTYAHTLMMAEERLADAAALKHKLQQAVAFKEQGLLADKPNTKQIKVDDKAVEPSFLSQHKTNELIEVVTID